MVGGILQIVARGADDVFLVDNPQITFFKYVYRRYTNFSIAQQDLSFNTKLKFGGSAYSKIKRIGDLLNKMYLVIELPDVEIYYHDFTNNKLNCILKSVG